MGSSALEAQKNKTQGKMKRAGSAKEEEASAKGNCEVRWKRKKREASVMSACSSNAMCAGRAKKKKTSVMNALEVGRLRLKRRRRK